MNETIGFGKLEVKGYRRLEQVTVDFTNRSLAVLIGANGSGKTSLLKVFELLSEASSGNLRSYLSRSGGLVDIVTRGKVNQLSISLEMPFGGQESPVRYLLELGLRKDGYEIKGERLTEQLDRSAEHPFKYVEGQGTNVLYHDPETRRLVRPNWDIDPLETALSQVPRMYQRPEAFRKLLASCEYFAPLNVAPNSPIRQPQAAIRAVRPQPDGNDTLATLYNLREINRERFERIEDTLRVVFPDFQELTFPLADAGKLTLNWREAGIKQPFSIDDLSEGTVRFLWLTTLLASEELPGVLIIDEPEVSLHPAMLQVLAGQLREAAKRTLVLVATHSERLVAALAPSEILVADMEEGQITLTWADQKADLSRWLEDYSLGQLWAMNILGGRP